MVHYVTNRSPRASIYGGGGVPIWKIWCLFCSDLTISDRENGKEIRKKHKSWEFFLEPFRECFCLFFFYCRPGWHFLYCSAVEASRAGHSQPPSKSLRSDHRTQVHNGHASHHAAPSGVSYHRTPNTAPVSTSRPVASQSKSRGDHGTKRSWFENHHLWGALGIAHRSALLGLTQRLFSFLTCALFFFSVSRRTWENLCFCDDRCSAFLVYFFFGWSFHADFYTLEIYRIKKLLLSS